jgi:hypothetical protein
MRAYPSSEEVDCGDINVAKRAPVRININNCLLLVMTVTFIARDG